MNESPEWLLKGKEKDKESLQEERDINACYFKIYQYYLKGTKIKLRLKTHPEYFFEGIVTEVNLSNGKVLTKENIKEEKNKEEIIRKNGFKFYFDMEIEKEKLVNNEINYNPLCEFPSEELMEEGNFFILQEGNTEIILNTYEVDASSIHPAEINPIAYFTRGNISEESRRIVKERCNGLCELKLIGCSNKMEEIDHWIPVSRGGSEDISNLRGTCSHCNKKKSNKLWGEVPENEKIKSFFYEEQNGK